MMRKLNLDSSLNHREFIPISKDEELKSQMIVPSYTVGEDGKTVCVPVPECELRRCTRDGKSFEIVNLMYGTMPDMLGTIQMDDAMVTAEKITTECVRRFGTLKKQRDEIENKIKTPKFEE